MFYGNLIDGNVILTSDPSQGRPISQLEQPTNIPVGYHAESRFVDAGSSITQVWDIIPNAGTPQDAALLLAQMQAKSLSDDEALEVAALYPEWSGNDVIYTAGDRVLHNGELYKVMKDHVSKPELEPGSSSSDVQTYSTETDELFKKIEHSVQKFAI